ncbi:hypothetical protein GCM10027290_67310 [Micromonospora sonneratiae]|uniref:Hydrolytic protein n=1 Tax=Micromonospora sonneratiae TaxID=1184706 RepID=A0ABW3YQ77_9ACTN
MTTVANLDRISVEVTPGEEALCLLEIRNDGSIVESYVVEVVGDAAAWTTAEPSLISVYPGTAERVSLYFRPPRSAQVPSGAVPYAVRVTPTENPAGLTVPEGVVHVLPFVDTTAEIVPRTSKGRWGARHEVAIDNRSNTPVQIAMTGSDPDNRLKLGFEPETLSITPGQAAFVKVRAKPRRLLWRGHPATLPFQVVVTPADAPPAALDAATVQTPILPRNLGRLIAALLVLLLLGAGLWMALVREVKSLAKEVTAEQLAPIAQKADEANENAKRAVNAAGATTAPGQPTPSAATTVPPSPALPGVPAGASAFARRLQTTVGTNGTRSDQYTVPTGKTFVLTDIFLQNPQGDEGRLDLIVDGTTVLTVALNNFRDLDYHMVSPMEVPAGKVISIRVTCRLAGAALPGTGGGGQCRDFALLSGYHRNQPSTPRP